MRLLTQVVATVGAGAMASAAWAVPVNHGDFNGANYDFVGVSEGSTTDPGVEHYGPPQVTGDALTFQPIQLGAFATAGGIDLTNAALAVSQIRASGAAGVDHITVTGAGDFALMGVGTADTQASLAATVFGSILEIDGVSLDAPVDFTFSLAVTPDGGDFNLVDHGGNGIAWSALGVFDIAAFAATEGLSGPITAVAISVNTTLFALSEPSTAAFVGVNQLHIGVLPEPGTLLLLGAGGTLIMYGRRARA